MTIVTGILMPRSTLYPTLGHDWLNGIKAFLKKSIQPEKLRLIIDNIGFGADEQDIYSKAEKMLLQEDASIVVVFADMAIAELLSPLFTATNKLLLLVNFGANFPDNWQPSPTTIIHSLNFCFHAGLTGKYAAASGNKEVVNVISYYDGGYRQCFCLLNSNQQAGGLPVFNFITPLKTAEFSLKEIEKFLSVNPQVKKLLCSLAGDQAEKFYEQVAPLQQQYQLQLLGTPMLIEETLQIAAQGNDVMLTGYIPWHSSLNNEANGKFTTTVREHTGKTPGYFSLLGWETGILLEELFLNETLTATEIVNSVKGKKIDSPGGFIKIDTLTQHTYRPSYLAQRTADGNIEVLKEYKDIEQEWDLFTKTTLLAGESSNWRNTYLCI